MKIALIHGVTHIEYNAMNMYVDTIRCFIDEPGMNEEFIKDIVEHPLVDIGLIGNM